MLQHGLISKLKVWTRIRFKKEAYRQKVTLKWPPRRPKGGLGIAIAIVNLTGPR